MADQGPPPADTRTAKTQAPPTQGQIRHDDADPNWLDRDRVLCAPDAPASAPGARHPWPAGLAFGAAVGMAVAERLLAARFGRSLVDHRTWLIAGAAELAAGTAHEAGAAAGLLGLARLAVLVVVPAADAPGLARFTAMGWVVRRVSATAPDDVAAALKAAERVQKPILIALVTEPETPLPPNLFAALSRSPRAAGARRSWLKRLRRHAAEAAFRHAFEHLPVAPRLPAPNAALADTSPQTWFESAIAQIHELALLPPHSTLQPAPHAPWLTAPPDAVWAPRPQALSAALLGIALHGGLLPAGRFSMAALPATAASVQAATDLHLQIVQLITPSSGEQTVSPHRPPAWSWSWAWPGALFTPGDERESVASLRHALQSPSGPSTVIISDSRATRTATDPAGVSRGGYRVADPAADLAHPCPTLIASGALLGLAIDIRALLAGSRISAAIASIPCWQLFLLQDRPYRETVQGRAPCIALVPSAGAPIAALLRRGDLLLVANATTDPATLAARITRHLARNPAILEDSDCFLEAGLETLADMD